MESNENRYQKLRSLYSERIEYDSFEKGRKIEKLLNSLVREILAPFKQELESKVGRYVFDGGANIGRIASIYYEIHPGSLSEFRYKRLLDEVSFTYFPKRTCLLIIAREFSDRDKETIENLVNKIARIQSGVKIRFIDFEELISLHKFNSNIQREISKEKLEKVKGLFLERLFEYDPIITRELFYEAWVSTKALSYKREPTRFSTKAVIVAGILSFALAVTIMLGPWSWQPWEPIPLFETLLIGFFMYFGILAITYVHRRWKISSKVMWPLRRYLQFALSSVIIEEYDIAVDVSADGNAQVVHRLDGKVNFGVNKWMEIDIESDGKQPIGRNFRIHIENLDTGELVDPELVVDYPRLKKIRIHFDRPLRRGERFHYRIEYPLVDTFFFNQDDYYSHGCKHHEKRIRIRVFFEDSIFIRTVEGEVLTQHGESWPVRTVKEEAQFGRHYVEWTISKASMGHLYKLWWKSSLKLQEPNAATNP